MPLGGKVSVSGKTLRSEGFPVKESFFPTPRLSVFVTCFQLPVKSSGVEGGAVFSGSSTILMGSLLPSHRVQVFC